MRSQLLAAFLVAPLIAASQLPSYVPESELVAWFPLNGEALDSGPNSIGYDFFSATGTVDRFGHENQALLFNGNGDMIQGDCALFPTSDRTVAFWTKFEQTSGDLWFTGYGGGSCGTSSVIYGNSTQCNALDAVAHSEHCCQGTFEMPYDSIPSNEWLHIALTSDASGAKFYLNGSVISTRGPLGGVNTNGVNYFIGAAPSFNGLDVNMTGYFEGGMDDIGFWSRALSEAEIQVLYNAPAPIFEGCTDNTACNYNPAATEDDGSCTYAEYGRDCDGNCLGGTIWYVDGEAEASQATGADTTPFTTIQEALDAACPSDEVRIKPGTYVENVSSLVDDLTIRGYAPYLPEDSLASQVIIDGAELATAFYVSGDQTVLQDLTIQNGKSPYGAGLYLSGANNSTVQRCIIRDNVGTGDITAHGIALNSSNCLIENCLITGNYGRKHTINVNNSGHTIRNCRIVNNPTWEEGGGIVVYAPNTLIENCLIAGNNNGGITSHRTGVMVDHCTIVNNSNFGCFVWCSANDADLNISNSIISNNGSTAFKMSQTGIRTATARLRNSIVTGGVDYDWTSAYKVFDTDSTLNNLNPLLLDDFTLYSASSAIGTASGIRFDGTSPLGPSSAAYDLNFEPRPSPAGSNGDLGCFESPLGEPGSGAGCTDAEACNYDDYATIDDGSCEYPDVGEECDPVLPCPIWPEDTVIQCLYGSTELNAGIQRGTYFDGVDDWILMAESGVTGTHPMTISFWALTGYNGAMDIFSQSCGTDCGSDIRCGMNTPQCGLVGPSFKSPAHFATFPFEVDDQQWHQYTYVFGDGSFSYNNLKIYVDGNLFSAATVDSFCGHNWGGWTYNAPDLPIKIGKGGPLGGMFRGYLDDIAVWSEALSWDDVISLQSSSPEDIDADLLSFWPLDELEAGYFTDVVSGNNGAPLGGIGIGTAPISGIPTWSTGSQFPIIEVTPNANTTYSATMVLSSGQVCTDSIVVAVVDDLFTDTDGNGICDAIDDVGCTDAGACNYSAYASEDDGSCDYSCCPGPGCCDDGTQWNALLQACTTSPADTVIVYETDTLIVTLTDTLLQLDTLIIPVPACGEGTIWNPVLQECIVAIPADLNWDGCVTTNDLLEFLPVHGSCPPLPEWPGYPEEEVFSSCACDYENSVNYHNYDYDIVAIGNQCWFAENLRTQSYRNGTPIPFAGLDVDWSNAHQTSTGSWCYPGGDPSTDGAYGLMYNHWVVMNGDGEICPSGWHVPTDNDFVELEMHMGMSLETALLTDWRGTDEGTRLKSSPNDYYPWNGTNEVGFSWTRGGWRHVSGSYGYLDGLGLLMFTPSSISGGAAYGIRQAGTGPGGLVRSFGGNAGDGRSIRCVKD